MVHPHVFDTRASATARLATDGCVFGVASNVELIHQGIRKHALYGHKKHSSPLVGHWHLVQTRYLNDLRRKNGSREADEEIMSNIQTHV